MPLHGLGLERVPTRRWLFYYFYLFILLARHRSAGGALQDRIPEIRGWHARQDRRRHGSPQLVPGCRHQLGQVPLRLLLPSAGGQARQGKTSGNVECGRWWWWGASSAHVGSHFRTFAADFCSKLRTLTAPAPLQKNCMWDSHATCCLHLNRALFPAVPLCHSTRGTTGFFPQPLK